MPYKHLTLDQRYTIFNCLKRGDTQAQIAEALGVSQSTISRELKRNSTKKRHSYNPKYAQQLANERTEWTKNNKSCDIQIKRKALTLLETEDWSPEQICGYLLRKDGTKLSFKSIYNWIEQDKKQGGKLYLHCRHRCKKRKKRIGGSLSHIPNRTSIHERPIEGFAASFGDIEMDTIVGANQKECIVTLVDKATGFLFMDKLKNGPKPKDVADAVFKMLIPFKKYIRTITTDNGLEFREHQLIAKRLDANVYFADPYAAWQKGAIENANKLIRQYIPKKTSFKQLSDKDIKEIQYKINRRPRKKLHYYAPVDLFAKILQ